MRLRILDVRPQGPVGAPHCFRGGPVLPDRVSEVGELGFWGLLERSCEVVRVVAGAGLLRGLRDDGGGHGYDARFRLGHDLAQVGRVSE